MITFLKCFYSSVCNSTLATYLSRIIALCSPITWQDGPASPWFDSNTPPGTEQSPLLPASFVLSASRLMPALCLSQGPALGLHKAWTPNKGHGLIKLLNPQAHHTAQETAVREQRKEGGRGGRRKKGMKGTPRIITYLIFPLDLIILKTRPVSSHQSSCRSYIVFRYENPTLNSHLNQVW